MTSHAKSAIEPRRLISDKFERVCNKCGAVFISPTADEVLEFVANCTCQQRHFTQYLVELVCVMCGRPVGTLVAQRPAARIMVPQEMRCGQCGGRPVVDDVLEVSVYPDLPRVQGRRGRPPRWLVEQRRSGNDNTARPEQRSTCSAE